MVPNHDFATFWSSMASRKTTVPFILFLLSLFLEFLMVELDTWLRGPYLLKDPHFFYIDTAAGWQEDLN